MSHIEESLALQLASEVLAIDRDDFDATVVDNDKLDKIQGLAMRLLARRGDDQQTLL